MKKTLLKTMMILFGLSLMINISAQVQINGVSDSTAILNEAFTSQVDVGYLGDAPSYELLESPATMAIDASGEITWTPTDIATGGRVTVRSWNSGGSALFTFNVYVSDEVVCSPNLIAYYPLDETSGVIHNDFIDPLNNGTKSGKGLYGDVMLEIDWSVGQINQALKENGLDKHTLVILTSDNGPWVSYGNHAGTTPFREAKGTSFDGGVRSACLMKLPGEIKAGAVSERTLGSIDLLPTLCYLSGLDLPDNEIDGKNVWELITGMEGAENPHDYYAFSNNSNFEGIISGDGKWKLHLPHNYRSLERAGMDGQAGKYTQLHIDTALFHMEADPYESTNVIEEYPELAAGLIRLAALHKSRFYDE